jgi:hypothetical protein
LRYSVVGMAATTSLISCWKQPKVADAAFGPQKMPSSSGSSLFSRRITIKSKNDPPLRRLSFSSPSCISRDSRRRGTRKTPTPIVPLQAVSVSTADSQHAGRWHQRVFQRVVRGGRSDGSSSSTRSSNEELQRMQSTYTSSAPSSSLFSTVQSNSTTTDAADAFILNDFATMTPSMVLPPELERELAEAAVAVEEKQVGAGVAGGDDDSRGSPVTRLTRGWAETALTTLLDRWSKGMHENLSIICAPQGNVMELVKGYFRCDAVVEFDRIAFPCIQMSGGRLESHRLALNLYRFKPISKPIPRFPDQFDLEAHDMLFKEEDLFGSPCIRNGLQKLLMRILRGRGLTVTNVDILSIKILPSGKVSCKGQAAILGSPVPFEVRTGLATSSRGHILTFPGLEISLGGGVGLFVPVIPDVNVDLGHNAQIKKLRLDGVKRTVTVSCRTTIAPRHTVKLLHDYQQNVHAYAAKHYVDVGSWLTRIGKFSN